MNGRVGLTVANGTNALSIAVSTTRAAMTEADLGRLMASRPLLPGGMGLRLVHDIVAGLGGTPHHDHAADQTVIGLDLPAQAGDHA